MVASKKPIESLDDLALLYTPGVGEACRLIAANRDLVYDLTGKGNIVAVVTDGSAVLGLGDIGPDAGLPVMEGKCVLFKEFGGVDAFPICLDLETPPASFRPSSTWPWASPRWRRASPGAIRRGRSWMRWSGGVSRGEPDAACAAGRIVAVPGGILYL